MKCLMRPYWSHPFGVAVLPAALVAVLGAAAWLGTAPRIASAQAVKISQFLEEPTPLLMVTSSQGYLGVDIADVDNEKAQSLRLKEVRGAVITLIDHDAPAGKIGLRINDVILQVNGQNVESSEQLRRMLKGIPAGHKVNLVISRDGNQQTLAVELVDRRAMEHEVWSRLGSSGYDQHSQHQGMGILSGGGDASTGSGFHMPSFGSSLNVGALVEPLSSQMAEYLGVSNGVMVKQVARKSAAASAGLKSFDVILKVGNDNIATTADWERALHANQGKTVQVTILRDKKQQTITMQVDSKHHQGKLAPGEILPPEFSAQMAENLREQTEKLQEYFQPEDIAKNIQIDRQQLDQLKQQMEQFQRDMERWRGFSFDNRV
jgi:serine protease Do